MRINCLTGTKMTPNVMCKESQPNLIVPVPTQGCLFFYCMCSCSMGHSWLQGNQFTMVWISIIWCVYKIYKCIYKPYKYIKHNRHFRNCFVPFWNTESENTAHVWTEQHRGLQKISLSTHATCLSPLGAMQITGGCEVFVLVINSSHPFCARTILASLPSMSIFIKDYLAHCVLKNTNMMLNTFPENKIQSCLRLCFWIINCRFSFILLTH